MTVHTIAALYNYGFRKDAKNGDKELLTIVRGVENYLKKREQKRFFLSIAFKYHKRCCKSWAKVSLYLQKFLNNPKSNYSMLMFVLEQEKEKFRQPSFYGGQLCALFALLESGPNFSEMPLFYL